MTKKTPYWFRLRRCKRCGGEFEPQREKQVYCSTKCRVYEAVNRHRGKLEEEATPPVERANDDLARQFRDHRNSAIRRGIAFLLTYDEWLRIWEASGHLHERGCLLGQYVMARHGDTGPYAEGNVSIILAEENNRAAGRRKGRHPITDPAPVLRPIQSDNSGPVPAPDRQPVPSSLHGSNPDGSTPGALQGDDYQLEYYPDGYPKLPDFLRR